MFIVTNLFINDMEKYLTLPSEVAVKGTPFCIKMWAFFYKDVIPVRSWGKNYPGKNGLDTTLTSIRMVHGPFLSENLRKKVSR